MRRFIKTVNDSHCCCCCCCCRYSLLALTRSQRRVKETAPLPCPQYPTLLLVTVLNARVCPFGGTNLSLRLSLSPSPSPLSTPFQLFSASVVCVVFYNYARSLPDAVDLCYACASIYKACRRLSALLCAQTFSGPKKKILPRPASSGFAQREQQQEEE